MEEALIHEDKNFKNIVYTAKETYNREFENCTFENCNLSNAVFVSSKFMDCIFTNCNLTMTKLDHCQLNNVHFKDCKLMGINFSECISIPFIVKFEGCILDYCSFAKKKLVKTTFIDSSMKSVDFTECDLTKSVFSDTDLLNAIFNRTILREANLLSAINYTIDPEMNTLKKAKFSLTGVVGLLNKYGIIIE